jgi:hypothetical protein
VTIEQSQTWEPLYVKRAAKRFLEGTNCSSPVGAVEKGIRSLSDWAVVLLDELELEKETRGADSAVRRKQRLFGRRGTIKQVRVIN